mgnify:CR=1 FL=1|jgi:hypothetical protein
MTMLVMKTPSSPLSIERIELVSQSSQVTPLLRMGHSSDLLPANCLPSLPQAPKVTMLVKRTPPRSPRTLTSTRGTTPTVGR